MELFFKKRCFLKCEKALYGIMIGDSRGLSLEEMHESIEKVCDSSNGKNSDSFAVFITQGRYLNKRVEESDNQYT